jgi:protein-S-isoprenylcysteine O-methyltransferase Ste14
MKPSKMQTALSLAGSLFLLLGIFSKPLGLSETWEWIAPILAIGWFIPLIALQRRRRNARSAAGLPAAKRPPRKRRFWLLLVLVVAGSLSGPLWLPYTGTTLPTSTLIITSIISCALAILVFVLSWRYWNQRSNQSLQPTTGRRTERLKEEL